MDERLETTVCYRHPDRPTRLRCSECNRPICVECSHDAAVGQKCPECAKPHGRYRVVDARRAVAGPSFETSPVTFSIIAVTAAIFLLSFASIDLSRELEDQLSWIKVLIEDGELWRMVSPVLLHGGILHIGFNMYALYLFGPRLEREVGGVAFAAMYLAAAAGGSLLSVLTAPESFLVPALRAGEAVLVWAPRSIGASGAIFGLFGAWIFVAYKLRSTPAGRAMFNQLAVLLLLNAALPLFIPNIDWRAHLGGFATGILIAWSWSALAVGKPNARRIRATIAIALLVIALAIPPLL
jgi:membrane associated rhomboid family serine protease